MKLGVNDLVCCLEIIDLGTENEEIQWVLKLLKKKIHLYSTHPPSICY